MSNQLRARTNVARCRAVNARMLGERFREVPMCECCGWQALASSDALTRGQVLALISDIRPARLAGDAARQADPACRIAAMLRPHTIVEEQGLFAALAPDFPEQIALLEAEHRLIEAPLAEAVRAVGYGELPADPAWPDRLTRALAVLREHIFKEQDGVFPAALATLRTADWEAVDAARLAVAAVGGESASAP